MVVITVLIASGVIAGIANYYAFKPIPTPVLMPPTPSSPSPTPIPTPYPWLLMEVRVFLWENGESRFVGSPQSALTAYLLQTLHRANLQLRCGFTDEQLEEIKNNGLSLELSYRFHEDILTSQWIEPENRDFIKTDEDGYRILEEVKRVFFILEDPLDTGLKAHFLVEESQGRSCWAIQKEGEVDESWVEEVKRYLLITDLKSIPFELSLNPDRVTVSKGRPATVTVTIHSIEKVDLLLTVGTGDYVPDLAVELPELPSEITVQFDRTKVSVEAGSKVTVNLTLSIGNRAIPGTYTLQVFAIQETSYGNVAAGVPLQLTIPK